MSFVDDNGNLMDCMKMQRLERQASTSMAASISLFISKPKHPRLVALSSRVTPEALSGF
jgi:hypothetical protein